MVRIWLRVALALVLCSVVSTSLADEIAVDMTTVPFDAEDYALACEIDSCDALTDDQAIRDQIGRYVAEIGWLMNSYLILAPLHAQAQEREEYWRGQRLLAQTPEERAETTRMYNNYFNLRLQLGAKMSRTMNRIQILFSLIESLQRKLQ